jgi:transcriptional regulator with XRE-family HTH domain
MAQFLLVYEGWSQYRIAKEFAISPKTLTRLANGKYEKKAPGRKPKFNGVCIS